MDIDDNIALRSRDFEKIFKIFSNKGCDYKKWTV